MIGHLAREWEDGRADARAGRPPMTCRERGTWTRLHAFYLMGYRSWRGIPEYEQTNLFGAELARNDAPGSAEKRT